MEVGIGVVCTVIGALIGFLSFNRNRDKDVRVDAAESAVIRTKLDNINSGVDAIRIDIKGNENKISSLTETVIRIDESTKQAHKRIDAMEGK